MMFDSIDRVIGRPVGLSLQALDYEMITSLVITVQVFLFHCLLM